MVFNYENWIRGGRFKSTLQLVYMCLLILSFIGFLIFTIYRLATDSVTGRPKWGIFCGFLFDLVQFIVFAALFAKLISLQKMMAVAPPDGQMVNGQFVVDPVEQAEYDAAMDRRDR